MIAVGCLYPYKLVQLEAHYEYFDESIYTGDNTNKHWILSQLLPVEDYFKCSLGFFSIYKDIKELIGSIFLNPFVIPFITQNFIVSIIL